MRSVGVQDEEHEAQEAGAGAVAEEVGEGIDGGGVEWRFADDADTEAGGGERVGHRMQWPVPEGQLSALPTHRPLLGPCAGLKVAGSRSRPDDP